MCCSKRVSITGANTDIGELRLALDILVSKINASSSPSSPSGSSTISWRVAAVGVSSKVAMSDMVQYSRGTGLIAVVGRIVEKLVENPSP